MLYPAATGFVKPGPGGSNKIWGSSSDNMYFVGTNGKITHYDGTNWTRLESGTDLPIQDVWGSVNEETGETEILAVASEKFNNNGKKLLRIKKQFVTTLPDSGLPWSLSSIWFIPEEYYYIVGDGIFTTNNLDSSWSLASEQPLIYKSIVRGTTTNNVFVTGSFGLVSHYNGSTWKQYIESSLPAMSGGYWGLCLKDDIVIAVGEIDGKATVLKGKRK